MTYNDVFDKLARSKFRSSFKLKNNDIEYINKNGFKKIKEHAYDFVNNRISKYDINKDGKQTPMRGHPIFIAQHACACCCRGCLYKWYKIPKEKNLSDKEINFIVNLLMLWIKKEYEKNS